MGWGRKSGEEEKQEQGWRRMEKEGVLEWPVESSTTWSIQIQDLNYLERPLTTFSHSPVECIRQLSQSDQIRSNHLWGCFTHEHTHRHAHRSKGRPLMVALTFLSILHFWAMFTWPRGMRSHEAGKRGEINTNSLIQHVGRFCVFGYVFFHVHCFLTYEQTECQASAVHANFYIEL